MIHVAIRGGPAYANIGPDGQHIFSPCHRDLGVFHSQTFICESLPFTRNGLARQVNNDNLEIDIASIFEHTLTLVHMIPIVHLKSFFAQLQHLISTFIWNKKPGCTKNLKLKMCEI